MTVNKISGVDIGTSWGNITGTLSSQSDLALELDGKQDEITSSHKLSADLVTDASSTNKFVTPAEKTEWSNKQDLLTFDDVPTSSSDNPVKSGGIYTSLSGKVAIAQGIGESGKFLKVGADGNVTTGTAVSDYPDLTNKPSINSVTIVGDKTSEQLNIVTNLTKAQYDALTTEEKMSGKIFFTTDESGGGGGGGVSDYNDLTNRPQVNSVTLTGNKSSEELNIVVNLTKAQYDALGSAEKMSGKIFCTTDESSSDVVWGDITGTLSNQTDLEVALTGKQPVANAVSLSAPTAITIADNTDYTLTDVASLTFTYPASGSYQAFITMTTASSGTITIVFPSSMYVPKVPTFGNSETWLIGITNGIIIAQKAVSS